MKSIQQRVEKIENMTQEGEHILSNVLIYLPSGEYFDVEGNRYLQEDLPALHQKHGILIFIPYNGRPDDDGEHPQYYQAYLKRENNNAQ